MLKQVLDRLLTFALEDEAPSFRALVAKAGLDPAHDFVGASLRDLDLRDEDLSGFNFSDADLSGVDFRRANVSDVQFRGAILAGTIGLQPDVLAVRRGTKNKKTTRQSASPFAESDFENVNPQSDQWASLIESGNERAANGDAAGALKSYRESLAIAERLASSSDHADYRRNLSVSYERIAEALRALGQEDEAQKATLKSLAIGEPSAHLASNSQRVLQVVTSEARELSTDKLTVLHKHAIFRDLEPEALTQLCRYAKYVALKRGATIFSKGDPGNSLFAVISGTVKISTSSADGRTAILNIIGAGEIFGEVAVLDGQARTADAFANASCEILIIDRREFVPFVRSQPALAMKFIELLCARLRWTSDQVEQIILQNLPNRLASVLIRLSDKHRLASGTRTIAVTQQEISEMIGMSRESINKQLRIWAARNWIQLEHGSVTVLDVQPLQALIEEGLGDEADNQTR
jgi:CRP/FNR family cyclic AMP-dependent transcriptional regulator